MVESIKENYATKMLSCQGCFVTALATARTFQRRSVTAATHLLVVGLPTWTSCSAHAPSHISPGAQFCRQQQLHLSSTPATEHRARAAASEGLGHSLISTRRTSNLQRVARGVGSTHRHDLCV